jgi:hypothetical protein
MMLQRNLYSVSNAVRQWIGHEPEKSRLKSGPITFFCVTHKIHHQLHAFVPSCGRYIRQSPGI